MTETKYLDKAGLQKFWLGIKSKLESKLDTTYTPNETGSVLMVGQDGKVVPSYFTFDVIEQVEGHVRLCNPSTIDDGSEVEY